ncbi:probable carboxylesterase 12 [Phoenix dactylifera]|uniref:Probable carboxylesterase 12 n=1 Tax=Phoenix dactylifera TaxID=42345 RepID=A0A8B7BFK0_PHODC|nr:probable carboxylesterase 12 [Phoenix dactylifera]
MDPDKEIDLELFSIIRVYKSGRIERLVGTDTVPAGVDPDTGVTSKDVTIDPSTAVSARLHLPNLSNAPNKKLPILVYYHGGGFCSQSAFSSTYFHFIKTLVAQSGILLVSVNYRLAPEHPLPIAYDDSWAALRWVASHSGGGGGPEAWLSEHGDFLRVFLAGDSSGANIAHHMALRAGAEGLGPGIRIEGLILFHPYFWGKEPVESEPALPEFRSYQEAFWRLVCPGTAKGLDDPLINPLSEGAPGLEGLAGERTLVCLAEDELRWRGRAYYERLKGSGWRGEAELVESEGEYHVFHLMKPDCQQALLLMERVVEFLKCKDQ